MAFRHLLVTKFTDTHFPDEVELRYPTTNHNNKIYATSAPGIDAMGASSNTNIMNACFSILLVTDTHLIVLREVQAKQGYVEMIVNRNLSTIGRITTKKKHPEFITFQYGTPNCDEPMDMDRLDSLFIFSHPITHF